MTADIHLKIRSIMRLASRNPVDHDVNFMIGEEGGRGLLNRFLSWRTFT
jgi:hypothetical protein